MINNDYLGIDIKRITIRECSVECHCRQIDVNDVAFAIGDATAAHVVKECASLDEARALIGGYSSRFNYGAHGYSNNKFWWGDAHFIFVEGVDEYGDAFNDIDDIAALVTE